MISGENIIKVANGKERAGAGRTTRGFDEQERVKHAKPFTATPSPRSDRRGEQRQREVKPEQRVSCQSVDLSYGLRGLKGPRVYEAPLTPSQSLTPSETLRRNAK